MEPDREHSSFAPDVLWNIRAPVAAAASQPPAGTAVHAPRSDTDAIFVITRD